MESQSQQEAQAMPDMQQTGGVPTKVTIAGKQYTIYVKLNGEFMTVRQAIKATKTKKASKKSSSPKKSPSKQQKSSSRK